MCEILVFDFPPFFLGWNLFSRATSRMETLVFDLADYFLGWTLLQFIWIFMCLLVSRNLNRTSSVLSGLLPKLYSYHIELIFYTYILTCK
jgi:hypothetical protein